MLLFIIFLIWRCFKKPPIYEIPAWDITKGHRWSVTDILSRTGYCSVCENLIVDGLFCDCCGICVDHGCCGVADRNFACKTLSSSGDSISHHWVKGNTSPNSRCAVCGQLCGLEAALSDFRCCWCQRTVHTGCTGKLAEVCDLGRHRACVVPPYCVRLRMVGWKGRRHLVVRSVNPPSYSPWSPLIVVANRRSGNNDGEHVLSAFRGILNPAQVVDLNDLPPESALEWCHLIKGHTCRIIVAGGDGTINWIFTVIDRLKLQPLDQGVIRSVKAHYRKRPVQRLLINLRLKLPTSISVRQAAEIVAGAWWNVTAINIQNCWRKAGLVSIPHEVDSEEGSEESDVDVMWQEVAERLAMDASVTFEDFVECDSEAYTLAELTIDDILSAVRGDEDADGEDDAETAPMCQPEESLSNADIMECVRKMRTYLGRCSNATDQEHKNVDSFEAFVPQQLSGTRQAKITDFFKTTKSGLILGYFAFCVFSQSS
ncbi:hypothetical protein HPB51_018272 [Rhipicephalus microplus]|uniref:Diacylglycerol kinase n=1 Tax=Rhipicephalus microplus TaxID=6941 RepID=A0A9J6D666_RHIMP|nr:hypothetical protein HPB51_018272 [Rhipicephalus microplus]